MKTNFPSLIQSRSRRASRALTILEMLVSVAMLAFIILGLTAMFVQTQKAFKSAIKQTAVTDSGRAVIDIIAADLSQMTDPHFTNVPNMFNLRSQMQAPPPQPYPTNLFWKSIGPDLVQVINNPGSATLYRTNQLQVIMATIQTNSTWLGVGYYVSNWFTNGTGGKLPGVGTLYRYVAQTNGPMITNNFFYTNLWAGGASNFHRIADGVIHLKIYAYDANGNENTNELLYPDGPVSYPNVSPVSWNSTNFVTNYLPHSIDIELGVLEPEAFEHVRALYTAGAGAYAAAGTYLTNAAAQVYLTNAAAQVQVYRQHIIIPAAP